MFEVDDWVERLIDEKGEDLYRMKGVLSVVGSDQRYVLQVGSLRFILTQHASIALLYYCNTVI